MDQVETPLQYPLPPAAIDSKLYTSSDQFERETAQVFYKSWLRTCPSRDIAQPKDYYIWEELRQAECCP